MKYDENIMTDKEITINIIDVVRWRLR